MENATLQDMYDRLFGADKTDIVPINEIMALLEVVAERLGWPCIDSDQSDDNFVMTFKRGGL